MSQYQAAVSVAQQPRGKPPKATHDESTIRRHLDYLVRPGECFEIRILDADENRAGKIVPADKYKKTYAGYFDDINAAVREAMRADGASVYITTNPVNPDLMARACNRLRASKNTTSDDDVVVIRHMLIDADPRRPAGISATDAERAAAIHKQGQILWDHPEIADASLVGSSGNGAFILVRLPDYPNDQEYRDLVGKALDFLAKRYSDGQVEIDTTTRNPARIGCLAGTPKCKGESLQLRPHRTSTIDSVPGEGITFDLKAWVAANSPAEEPDPPAEKPAEAKAKGIVAKAGGTSPIERALAYLAKIAGGVQGSKGSRELRKAAIAGRRFAIPESTWVDALDREHNPRCSPQWSREEIEHAVGRVYRGGKVKERWGDLLDAGKSSSGQARESQPADDLLDVIPIPTAAKNAAPNEGVNETVDDPHRLARLFRDERCLHPDGLAMRYWQGEFRQWYEGAYHSVSSEELRPSVGSIIKREFDRANIAAIEIWEKSGRVDENGKPCPKPVAKKVTEPLKNNVVGNLATLTLLERSVVAAQPAWIDSDGPWPAVEVLPMRNHILHLPSLVAGSGTHSVPSTPRFFSDFALGYDFDLSAPEPVSWLTFLGSRPPTPGGRVQLQLWPDDPEAISLLQEWFGYSLTADTRQQKILSLIGPKRSGKDTIARILAAMIGAANVAGPTLASMATNFGLAPLVGKHLAIISDARLSSKTDSAVIVERLLTISGEGFLSVDRKFQKAWDGKLSTRFLIISNELPRLADSSGALAGRLLIQRLTRSFYGKEDEGLTDHLLAELPGILLWAIEGWRRLRERGHFVQPESGKELIAEMENLSSPIGAFVKEFCEPPGPGQSEPVVDVFAAWVAWCKDRGRDKPGDHALFSRNLRSVAPHVKTVQHRVGDSRSRYIEGIALNHVGRATLAEFRKNQSP
jgi:putative DNA primase/helicase